MGSGLASSLEFNIDFNFQLSSFKPFFSYTNFQTKPLFFCCFKFSTKPWVFQFKFSNKASSFFQFFHFQTKLRVIQIFHFQTKPWVLFSNLSFQYKTLSFSITNFQFKTLSWAATLPASCIWIFSSSMGVVTWWI